MVFPVLGQVLASSSARTRMFAEPGSLGQHQGGVGAAGGWWSLKYTPQTSQHSSVATSPTAHCPARTSSSHPMPIRISVPAVLFRDAAATRSLFTAPVGGVAVLVALVTVGWVVRAVHSWRRLRHVPGPALARWSSLWMVKRLSSGRFHEAMCEVMEEYGEFFYLLFPGHASFVQPHSRRRHVLHPVPEPLIWSRTVCLDRWC